VASFAIGFSHVGLANVDHSERDGCRHLAGVIRDLAVLVLGDVVGGGAVTGLT
jgi:hypothetical protein